MSLTKSILAIMCIGMLSSCRTTYNMQGADPLERSTEGNVVFVRPDKYTPLQFGTRSLGDYMEVTYAKSRVNDVGLLEVTVGFRNKGGQHIWDLKGRDFPFSIKCTFFASPDHSGPPVYETNWQPMKIIRGDTVHYKAVSVADSARGYQVKVSELIK